MTVSIASTDLTVGARDLCRLALSIYEGVARRLTWLDPDAGFAESFDAGRRALEHRVRATDWAVPSPVRLAAQKLFVEAGQTSELDADEWLDAFPRRFLELLDRRSSRRGDPERQRRTIDRPPISAGWP